MPQEETKQAGKRKSESSRSSVFEKIAPILIFLSIGLAFAVGVLWQKVKALEGGSSVKPQGAQVVDSIPAEGKLSESQAKKIPAISEADHIRGDRNAKVIIVEYSDYQCPYCKTFHPTMRQISEEYKDSVAWVYRHFPLDQIHPKARPAALASECVAELGGEDAFWGFTDKIFEDQTRLDNLASVVSMVGVSSGAFQNCLDSGKYKDKVEQVYQGGITAGITGTPGNLVINSKGDAWLIPGALPYASVKAVIEEALKGSS